MLSQFHQSRINKKSEGKHGYSDIILKNVSETGFINDIKYKNIQKYIKYYE